MLSKFYPMLKKGFALGVITLLATTAQAQPCTPVAGGVAPCTNGTYTMRINSVSTTGGLSNIANANNACVSPGYSDWPVAAPNIVRQNAGSTFNLTVNLFNHGQSSYPYKITVWVDWNHDNVFDNTWWSTSNPTGEMVWNSPATFSAYTLTSSTGAPLNNPPITVPTSAKNGFARMRIRAGTRAGTSPVVPPSSPHPCLANDFYFGEVEDYWVDVINPCLPPTNIKALNITDRSATVTWTPRGNALFHEYLITTTKGIPGNGNIFLKGNTINLPDVNNPIACDTKYYIYVRSICDSGSGGLPFANWDISAWAEDSFTTNKCCYAPEAAVNYITSTSAIASWTPVPSVIKYEYSINADTAMQFPQSGTITSQTSVVLYGLSPSKDYKFFVRAHCSPTPLSDWRLVTFLTQPSTGIGTTNASNGFELQAFPNPTKDIVKLHIVKGMRVGTPHITVTDITGKVILQTNMTDYSMDISLTDKPSGIYVIKYTDDNNSQVLKVNKQ